METTASTRRKRPSVAPLSVVPREATSPQKGAPQGALGQVLLSRGLLSKDDLQFILDWQKTLSREWPVQRLGSLLVKAGLVSGREVTQALSEQRNVVSYNELPRFVAPSLLSLLPTAALKEHGAVPLYIAGGTLVVAMVDAHDQDQIMALQSLTDYKIRPVQALQLHVCRLQRALQEPPPLSSHA